jgi:CRP/FNR family transcriptional regulator, anaerobic regulatory protein
VLLRIITISFLIAERLQLAAALLGHDKAIPVTKEPVMLTPAMAARHSVTFPMLRTPRAAEPRNLAMHLDCAPLRKLEAKEHVFTEGDNRSYVYRVETGAISLYKVMPDGRRQILGFAYPGDLIGLGACDEYRFNAQATRPTQLKCLRWASLQSVARHDPELGLRLYEAISLELAAAHDMLLSTGQRSATERVAAFLLAMLRRNERSGRDGAIIDLPMTRADIGDFLGLTIETVSRTFTKLRLHGIIDLAQSARVRVVDRTTLQEIAEGEGGR